jgi:precorrin-8X/cobalt-precorrin-8 methylmutase
VPKRGADSIWFCALERGADGRTRQVALENPATRGAAERRLGEVLGEWRGRSVLAGFDFPFGYVAGFAGRIGASDWAGVWRAIAELLEDDPATNANNRFDVAARLNERAFGAAFPFWGCPAGKAGTYLAPTFHRAHAAHGMPERRLAELRVRGPQPAFKLAGAGAAGGQALTGIPVVRRLREWLGGAVWPHETGLARPPRGRIVYAEVYPSLVPLDPAPGEVKDSAQVRALARHFAALDERGELAPLFRGDPALTDEERERVVREESWILGVVAEGRRVSSPRPSGEREGPAAQRREGEGVRPRAGGGVTPPPLPSPARGEGEEGRSGVLRYRYLRDPAAIYRRSFDLVRAATDLTAVPPALRPLAIRLVHAAGDPGLVEDLAWSPDAAKAGQRALAAGAPILVDAEMVAAGVTRARLPAGNAVLCYLNEPSVPALARQLGTTRSAAAVELWRPRLAGAVVAIGNAPTALFHLLEAIAGGAPRPALVLGFPVGFVGAAEAKEALAANRLGLEFVALRGRRGGSALAAAAVNALAAPPEEDAG